MKLELKTFLHLQSQIDFKIMRLLSLTKNRKELWWATNQDSWDSRKILIWISILLVVRLENVLQSIERHPKHFE